MVNIRIARLLYYIENYAKDALPQRYFAARRPTRLDQVANLDLAELRRRLRYYNKLAVPFTPALEAHTIKGTPRGASRYYFDFMETARYFPATSRVSTLFGDVTHVPDVATVVKSRPIGEHNANSVLMKLDKFRHFRQTHDAIPFSEKKAGVVWRGAPNNDRRLSLVKTFSGHPHIDVGTTGKNSPPEWQKPFLSIEQQLQYRYILSIEGNDVATNLKWIMSSNSLCFSPKLRFETWYMEGSLEAGRHYVEIRDDMSDLEEKFEYYERNPAEAQVIVREAQAYRNRFLDARMDEALSLLVLEKYLCLSGQLSPSDLLTEAMADA